MRRTPVAPSCVSADAAENQSRCSLLFSDFTEYDVELWRESERVAHRAAHFAFLRIVSVRLSRGRSRVEVLAVDRGRNRSVVDGEDAGEGLDRTGGAQQVAVIDLVAEMLASVDVLAEDLGPALSSGRSPAGVEVSARSRSDLAGVIPAGHGVAHRLFGALASGGGP